MANDTGKSWEKSRENDGHHGKSTHVINAEKVRHHVSIVVWSILPESGRNVLAAQDHFKQSTTRLYWIADKVIVRAPSCVREKLPPEKGQNFEVLLSCRNPRIRTQ